MIAEQNENDNLRSKYATCISEKAEAVRRYEQYMRQMNADRAPIRHQERQDDENEDELPPGYIRICYNETGVRLHQDVDKAMLMGWSDEMQTLHDEVKNEHGLTAHQSRNDEQLIIISNMLRRNNLLSRVWQTSDFAFRDSDPSDHGSEPGLPPVPQFPLSSPTRPAVNLKTEWKQSTVPFRWTDKNPATVQKVRKALTDLHEDPTREVDPDDLALVVQLVAALNAI